VAAILALEQISKRFGAVVVADAVDLALVDGEALGIIGPNGAGKTTLFGIAAGTVAPDAGRVLFDGADITRLPPERRCRMGLARAFQIPQPFSGMTVFENVVVAAAFAGGRREAAVYDTCADLLVRCGLADKANRRAGSLTLLDRKRLELARALATRPRVLLLDEPAAGVPEEERRDILAALAALPSDVAILLIEHDMDLVFNFADRISVLAAGRLMIEGAPETIAADERVRAVYLGESAHG
jgi:branched-chain amino acid transport system ATP-binding protein